MKKYYFKSVLLGMMILSAASVTAQDANLTSMGQNMSFEDLSAQDGNQTGSVANPPVGWNCYIGGNAVTTADEVRQGGISGWFGVNDDSEGDTKDGSYSFGIWNWTIPEFEISQTISGLENGTYIVRAGVMVGANGGGSRRTTQRIFGNLNSKYFAEEAAYDEGQLDQDEVYAFEGLEEPVTDRLLQEMSVRVFVWDGTLTFGFRTDGNVKAANRDSQTGADGWFKLDNFRIEKAEYQPDDALSIYRHFYNLLQALSDQPMQASLHGQWEQLAAATVSSSNSMEEISKAFVSLKELYPQVVSSVKAYAELEAMIDKAYNFLLNYQPTEETQAMADALSALIDDATAMKENGTADNDQISEMVEKLSNAMAELKKATKTVTEPTLVDGVEENAEYSYGADWGGNWFDQNGDDLDKDVSAFDYVWIKYENMTGRIQFGIIYDEWTSHQDWGESYYTDSKMIETESGIIGIRLEKEKQLKYGINHSDNAHKGDLYAEHVRQVFLQNQGAPSSIKVIGIWYGSEEDWQKAQAGTEKPTKKGLSLENLTTGWGGSEYEPDTHMITIGEENSGKGWWLASWNGTDNVGTDYSDFDKLVIEFAEPTQTGGKLTVEYYGGAEKSVAEFEAGATVAVVSLSDEGKPSVMQAYLQGPAGATFLLAAAYFCTNEVAPAGITTIHNYQMEKGQTYNLSGQKVDGSYKGIVIRNGKKMIQR